MLRMKIYPNDNQEQCYNKIEVINEGDNFASGESVDTVNTVSNLDVYLDKLYEKEIKFTVENDVVNFIQHGVESLVQDLMNFVMKQDTVQTEIAKLKERYSSASFMDKSELLKVGSFYEGTKNSFPDEFDFVYVVLCSATPDLTEKIHSIISIFNRCLFDVIRNMIKKDIDDISDYAIKMYENSQYSLEIVGRGDWDVRDGPNVKLHLYFKRKDSTHKQAIVSILVDITPGIKILLTNKEDISHVCPLKPFLEEVCVDGSLLIVTASAIGTKMTFTETEVRLMNKELSCRHRKVYRLLKYVMNADVNDMNLRELRNDPGSKLWLSSYELKIFMIYHHFECKRDESAAASSCLFDILERILSCVLTERIITKRSIGVERVDVFAGFQPLVYRYMNDISNSIQMTLFYDKQEYIELVKTLLNDLISDLKSKTNYECRDGNFEVITSFSERLYTNLQQIRNWKKRKGERKY